MTLFDIGWRTAGFAIDVTAYAASLTALGARLGEGGYDFIVATQDWHPIDHASFRSWPPHCVAGTRGADLHPLLDMSKVHALIRTGFDRDRDSYSGFSEQGLVLYGNKHVDPDGERVLDGLHVSASRGTLARLCNLEHGQFDCYAGYAGWGPGQLEREIGQGTWIPVPATSQLVLDTAPMEIWSACLRSAGLDPSSFVTSPGGEA